MQWYKGPFQDGGRNGAAGFVNEKDGSLHLIGGIKAVAGWQNSTLVLANDVSAAFEMSSVSSDLYVFG